MGPIGLYVLTNIVQVGKWIVNEKNWVKNLGSLLPWSDEPRPHYNRSGGDEILVIGWSSNTNPFYIQPSSRCWLLLLTANVYWSDPNLLPFAPSLLLPVCFSIYLLLIAFFLLSIRHNSQCLPRCWSPKIILTTISYMPCLDLWQKRIKIFNVPIPMLCPAWLCNR